MQIILVQAEIEAAIRALINSRFNADVPMTIELAATRGADGFKATIEISHEQLFPKQPLQATSPVVSEPPSAPTPGRTVGAQAVVEAAEAAEASDVSEEQAESAEQAEAPNEPQEEQPASQAAETTETAQPEQPEQPAANPRPGPSIFGRPKLVEVPPAEPEAAPAKTPLATSPEEDAADRAKIRAEMAAEEKDESMAEENAAEKLDPPFEVTAETKVASTDAAPAQAAAPATGEKRSLFKGLRRPNNG